MSLSERSIQVDTHTHTYASGHAWSTLRENCRAAADFGLRGICMTEHGPAMEGGISGFAPYAFRKIPKEIYGVRVIPGVEFNILDKTGKLDITDTDALRHVEFGIASLHDVIMPRTTRADHTEAYIRALEHPAVHILGHPGYAYFEHDPEPIVLAAKRLGKLLEINENSFASRAGSRENCLVFARLCKQHDVQVCVSTDAHFDADVGKTPMAFAMLDEVAFPPELILNLDADKFFAWLDAVNANRAARK